MIKPQLRAQVYYNLHHKTFSIQQSGRVKAHADGVMLDNARFLVSKKGQAKVRAEGRKNVHAKVSGLNAEILSAELTQHIASNPETYLAYNWLMATYNPYKHDWFIDTGTGLNVFEAKRVILVNHSDGPALIFYRPYSGRQNEG